MRMHIRVHILYVCIHMCVPMCLCVYSRGRVCVRIMNKEREEGGKELLGYDTEMKQTAARVAWLNGRGPCIQKMAAYAKFCNGTLFLDK